jgi:PEP-CTERM motif-containing protein
MVVLCGVAGASIIPYETSISAPVSGVYTWNYSVSVASDETLTTSGSVTRSTPPGTFFTIYDIVGYVASSASAPAGWSVSVQLLGITPSGANVTDSASLENVTWTYTGSNVAGPTVLSGFSFGSTDGHIATGQFSAQSMNNISLGVDDQEGPVNVPDPPVPEPASLGLMGGSLIGLGMFSKRLLRRAKA